MSTNFITPNELKQQQEKIARRKRMAELIRTSAATPIESPGVAGAKTSPWQVLIKALQGGIGGYEESQANKEEKALLARQDAAEKNDNAQFAAEQYPYGQQKPVPLRSPDDITPTETFPIPASLTPHQAPEMLPGADQAQYLASIAPTVKSQIPEQVPGREMPPPPPMQFGPPSQQRAAEFFPEQVPGREMPPPPPMQFGPPSQQRAAEFLDQMRRSPQPLGIPPGVDQADTSQIPEQVPGREMAPPPPNYIQSLVAALSQNKKSNEYVDQRRLALASVLNSKDPNKIKFMLDQMGNREQFEQQRQLESEKAGHDMTAAELKYNRDVQMARDKGDLDTLAYLQENKDKILSAKTLAKVNEDTATILNERGVVNANTQAGVKKDADKLLAEAKQKEWQEQHSLNVAKLNQQIYKDQQSLEKLNSTQGSNGANKNTAPVAVQNSALRNQQLLTETKRALELLNDPGFADSFDLGNLATKSLWPRAMEPKATELFSALSRIGTTQVLDITGQAATKRDMESINPMIPLIGGGFLGSKADTSENAKVKLRELLRYFEGKQKIVEDTYGFFVKGGDSPLPGGPDSPPPDGPTAEEWSRLSKEDKATYRAMEKK